MKNFEKEQPKLCLEILQNHITSNTEEYRRTIIFSVQTLGNLNGDEDSDYYVKDDELLDIPLINRLSTKEDTCGVINQDEWLYDYILQINSLDQQICKEKYDTQKEPDMVPFASVPVVQILSSSDDDIGRYEYYADVYSEDNDSVQLHLTVERH